MVWIVAVLLIIFLLILASRFSQNDIVPWLDEMQRTRPKGAGYAEWLATEDIMQDVMQHYMEYIEFAQETLLTGWVRYYHGIRQYLAGDYLQLQLRNLEARLRVDNVRLIDILRANHDLRIRDFGDDGLTCLLLDYQTERRLATYHYWNKRRVHTQQLDDCICVYRMRYDRLNRRWKITEYIQELPAHHYPEALEGPIDTLDNALPPTLGRDQ